MKRKRKGESNLPLSCFGPIGPILSLKYFLKTIDFCVLIWYNWVYQMKEREKEKWKLQKKKTI
jgi:hypothetical protein